MVLRQTSSESSAAKISPEEPADDNSAANGDAPDARPSALQDEQRYVTMLYGLLDEARLRSEQALADVRAQGGPGGTHQARLERDVSAAENERRLTQLNNTERGLCFGRTDDENQTTLYVGRIGLRDDDYELRLIDWRAPAARPFYACLLYTSDAADE